MINDEQREEVNDSESEVVLDDESKISSSEMELIEGDFVIVKVTGKSRTLHYVGRVDFLNGYEYGGVFLKKISKYQDTSPVFVIDEKDEATFRVEEIVHKLPTPKNIGG